MLIIGLALSMDAFAVTITNVIAYPDLSRFKRLSMPLVFGLLQGLMLLAGFFFGSLLVGYIEAFAGPVALVILVVIGGRMIFEAVRHMRKKKNAEEVPLVTAYKGTAKHARHARPQEEALEAPSKEAGLAVSVILVQGLATSFDALIVGVSLAALSANIVLGSTIVGLVTFLVCLAGLFIGKRVGALLGDKAQLVGGIILILVGIKICFF